MGETPDELRSLGNMFTIPDELTAPTCVVCHADAEQRCSRCHTEWYCSRKCQVSDWKRHEYLHSHLRAQQAGGDGGADDPGGYGLTRLPPLPSRRLANASSLKTAVA